MAKKKSLTIIIAIVLALTMFIDTTAVSAKSLSELQREIEKKQAQLDKGKAKEKSLAEQVNELEASIYELEAMISEGEEELEILEEELEEAREKMEKQSDELGGRLRNMYKNGSVGFLDVLLNSSSFSEFLTNMDLVQLIYSSDRDVLQELQDAHEEIETKKKKVETLTAELKSSRQTAQTEKAKIEEQKKIIAADNEETAKMLDNMEAEANIMAAELADKANNGSVSSSTSSKYDGGEFSWPAPGNYRITSGYGYRNCPFHGREFHPAIDIAGPTGSPVVAAASGVVVTSQYRNSFGNCIIIDHGGGVTTWYNHLSVRSVSVGTSVTKGQRIGSIGSTGDSTGPHLDFRVYIDGKSQNPNSYFN